MELEKKDFGLFIPVEKKETSDKQCSMIEIQDEEKREMAKKAMDLLWDAMDLGSGKNAIHISGYDTYDLYWNTYWMVGKMLLGDDTPEKEVLC